MKVAIMQPYFFPYIGYFQLINYVDLFVVYDDVNFIKQGWITKNRILNGDKDFNLILQAEGISSFKKINEIHVGKNNKSLLKTIEQCYKKAPFFNQVFPIIREIIMNDEKNLSKFLTHSLIEICKYLEIKTRIVYSSTIEKENTLKGQNKIIDICKRLNAVQYINAIGGMQLYDKNDFLLQDIHLGFIKSNLVEYEQFKNEFVSWLSIIDVMMFNDVNQIKLMLNNFELK
jgi:hypothetical protein